MTSTDAIASEADDQVDPHSSANCTIDLVSRSMKPAPRKKKWRVRLTPDTTREGEADPVVVGRVRRKPDPTAMTTNAETTSTMPSAKRRSEEHTSETPVTSLYRMPSSA